MYPVGATPTAARKPMAAMRNDILPPISVQHQHDSIAELPKSCRPLSKRKVISPFFCCKMSHHRLVQGKYRECFGLCTNFSSLRPPELSPNDDLQLSPHPPLVSTDPEHQG
jgi:hypothetical protein